jgi:hypothetical protein
MAEPTTPINSARHAEAIQVAIEHLLMSLRKEDLAAYVRAQP